MSLSLAGIIACRAVSVAHDCSVTARRVAKSGLKIVSECPVLNSRKAAQAKFGCMLRRLRPHALAFDTNRGWNPAMVLQPAPG